MGAVRAICETIYGSLDKAYDRVAITNVVHCNAGAIRGGVPTHMRYHCAHKDKGLMVTKKEIEILKPKKIISLAGAGGDAYILDHWNLDKNKILCPGHPAGPVSYKCLQDKVRAF